MAAEFTSNRPAVQSQFDANVSRCLTAIGLKQNELAAKEITDMNAVDTGRMRASNSYRLGDKEVIVGNTAYYAIYVNFGTRTMKGRPFLQNSVYNYNAEYQAIIKQYIGAGF